LGGLNGAGGMVNWHKTKRRARYIFLRILRLQGRPEQIAGGVALGLFLGFVLPPGTQTIVALGLAPILRCNPLAAAIFVWVSNPFTMPIIYPTALALGSSITGIPVRQTIPLDEQRLWAYIFNFLNFRTQSRLILNIATGLMVLGAISSFCSFYITKYLILWRRARRRKKKRARQYSA
jgi:uncharacterized protein